MGLLLVAGAAVASWYFFVDPIKTDSPFRITFAAYLIISLGVVSAIGAPYALIATVLLRRAGRRQFPVALGVALVPCVLLLVSNRLLNGAGAYLAPGTGIAAVIIAAGWWAMTFRRERQGV